MEQDVGSEARLRSCRARRSWRVALALGVLALGGCSSPAARTDTSNASLAAFPLAISAPRLGGGQMPALKSALGSGALRSSVAASRTVRACPPEMVQVRATCVDRYEGVLVELTSTGRELRHPAHERPREGVRYAARSIPGVLPQAYISRDESTAACANAGKRLCSLAEWYEACRGSRHFTYPYGNTAARGKCNSGKAHLLSRFFGSDSARWTYDGHFNNPRMNLEPGFLSPTGQYEECRSDYGTHDMVGNLHEWVSDPVQPSLAKTVRVYDGIRSALARNRGHGVFMGGFYSTTTQQGEGCNFLTPGHEPAYHDYSTGFRCCKDL